jgi:iron complex outermembrane receptor protein
MKSFRVYGTIQNLFVLTDYTGIDPEPVLADPGSVDNGAFELINPDGSRRQPDVLAPGIDRRNNYFTSRTFTFGVTLHL